MPWSKQYLPFPDLSPLWKFPQQKELSDILCLPWPCGKSFFHYPSYEDPSGKISFPFEFAFPQNTSPSYVTSSVVLRLIVSFQARCPKKKFASTTVPSCQITLPFSWGCPSIAEPIYLSPFFNGMFWASAFKLRGFLIGSNRLLSRSLLWWMEDGYLFLEPLLTI